MLTTSLLFLCSNQVLFVCTYYMLLWNTLCIATSKYCLLYRVHNTKRKAYVLQRVDIFRVKLSKCCPNTITLRFICGTLMARAVSHVLGNKIGRKLEVYVFRTSDFVLAETLVRLPRKLFIFIKKICIYRMQASQKSLIYFWKRNHRFRCVDPGLSCKTHATFGLTRPVHKIQPLFLLVHPHIFLIFNICIHILRIYHVISIQ